MKTSIIWSKLLFFVSSIKFPVALDTCASNCTLSLSYQARCAARSYNLCPSEDALWGLQLHGYGSRFPYQKNNKFGHLHVISGWRFQILFIFNPIWGRFPIWLVFFRWVETTNQHIYVCYFGALWGNIRHASSKKNIFVFQYPRYSEKGFTTWVDHEANQKLSMWSYLLPSLLTDLAGSHVIPSHPSFGCVWRSNPAFFGLLVLRKIRPCHSSICWWFRNLARKPVEVASLSHHLQGC